MDDIVPFTVKTQRRNLYASHLFLGDLSIAANGQLIVSDPDTINRGSPNIRDGGYDGAIIQVDPVARTQTVIARGKGSYVNPRGVAIVPNSLPARMAQARK